MGTLEMRNNTDLQECLQAESALLMASCFSEGLINDNSLRCFTCTIYSSFTVSSLLESTHFVTNGRNSGRRQRIHQGRHCVGELITNKSN